jgi:hypothetical protein
MDMNALLCGLTSYSFPDTKTGELIEGVKVRCLSPAQTDRPGVIGHEMVEFPAPYGILKPLLTVVRDLLGDEVYVPVILTGEFIKRGKFMNFQVNGMRAHPDS